MKRIYWDETQNSECIGIIMKDAQVIPAGAVVYSMPVNDKNSKYERFAKEYHIHFIFDDDIPTLSFYTIPMVSIFAADGQGGYIGSIGETVDIRGTAPICYIDPSKKCFLVAENAGKLLEIADHWKEAMTPYTEIEFFDSLKTAKAKYEFLDITEIKQTLSQESSGR